MVRVMMCGDCRHHKQKCIPDQGNATRTWIEGGLQERCAKCVQYNRLCGPPQHSDQQARTSIGNGVQESRRRRGRHCASPSGAEAIAAPVADRREPAGVSDELADDKLELRSSLGMIDLRFEALKRLRAKLQDALAYPSLHGDMYCTTLRSTKDANDSELLSMLSLAKPLAHRVETAGDMDVAEIAYTRMLSIYRAMDVVDHYNVRGLLRRLANMSWKRGDDQRAEDFMWEALLQRNVPLQADKGDLELLKELARSLSRTSKELSKVIQSTVVGPQPQDFISPLPPLQRMMESDYATNVAGNLLSSGPFLDPNRPLESPIVGGVEAVIELVEEFPSSDLEARDLTGRTPLYLASFLRREGLGIALIHCGGKIPDLLYRFVNARDHTGQTVLSTCIISNCSLPFIKILIEKGAEVNPDTVSPAWTPLQAASWVGSLEIVDFLLKRGARPEKISPNSQTAMEIAQERGHDDIVRRLSFASHEPSGSGLSQGIDYPP